MRAENQDDMYTEGLDRGAGAGICVVEESAEAPLATGEHLGGDGDPVAGDAGHLLLEGGLARAPHHNHHCRVVVLRLVQAGDTEKGRKG